MEVSRAYATSVIEDFFGWVEYFDECQEPESAGSFDLLQDYIFAWLEGDSGAKISGGDYGNFLLAVLIIIDEYTKRPSRLDYQPHNAERRERRVTGLIDLDQPGAVKFDRHIYMQEVFRQISGLD